MENRVLIVDDSKSVVSVLRSNLERKGYEVLVANNGREAVEKFKKYRPDLVTLDVQMPEMDGFEACAAIRALDEGKKTPVVFLTAHDTLADRERGFHLGATEFISKRSTSAWMEVESAVGRILQGQARLEGAVILVLEAEETTRTLVCSSLRAYGVQVLEAASGREALEIASERGGEIDLVLADCMVPGTSAQELCTVLRRKICMRHVPILFLATPNQRDIILQLFQAGATDYIIKPFVKEEFVARIGSHLEIRQLVRELAGNVAELERLNKLRDEFIAVSSHDLKAPLTGIMGFAQLLLVEKGVPEKQRNWLELIVHSSNFMLEIVNDIVELSRNEIKGDEVELVPLALDPLVSFSLASVEQSARKKGIHLELVAKQGEPEIVIEGERNRFTRILNNLLSNAIKFTPRGGTVTVSLGTEGERAELLVSDTGIGMPPEMLPTLFDRFSKVSKPGTEGERGTGLGMSITKQLVTRHHGTIRVESTEGAGTCFHLSFPVCKK